MYTRERYCGYCFSLVSSIFKDLIKNLEVNVEVQKRVQRCRDKIDNRCTTI